jgi:hypothetical protein
VVVVVAALRLPVFLEQMQTILVEVVAAQAVGLLCL